MSFAGEEGGAAEEVAPPPEGGGAAAWGGPGVVDEDAMMDGAEENDEWLCRSYVCWAFTGCLVVPRPRKNLQIVVLSSVLFREHGIVPAGTPSHSQFQRAEEKNLCRKTDRSLVDHFYHLIAENHLISCGETKRNLLSTNDRIPPNSAVG